MNTYVLKKTERESNIELLKILALFLIVISHVTQTLGNMPNNSLIIDKGYFINVLTATNNLQFFVLILFRHFGALGNMIFFVCSAFIYCII